MNISLKKSPGLFILIFTSVLLLAVSCPLASIAEEHATGHEAAVEATTEKAEEAAKEADAAAEEVAEALDDAHATHAASETTEEVKETVSEAADKARDELDAAAAEVESEAEAAGVAGHAAVEAKHDDDSAAADHGAAAGNDEHAAAASAHGEAAHGDAEHGGGHGYSKKDYVLDFMWRCVNFSILVGFLIYYARKPLMDFLFNRSKDIASAIERAEKMREEAEQKYNEYQKKIDTLDDEVARIVADFETDGEREKERIIERAKLEAEKIKKQVELTADSELQKAKFELQNEVGELAVKLAEELLGKNIGPQDQKKLIKDYLSKIGELQ